MDTPLLLTEDEVPKEKNLFKDTSLYTGSRYLIRPPKLGPQRCPFNITGVDFTCSFLKLQFIP